MEAKTFREAMSLLAAPLSVITTRDAAGRPWGFTASSVTSASLRPPLLLVGLSDTSSCHDAFSAAREFVVNLLGEEHTDIARTFATSGVDRFAAHAFENWPGTALPRLPGAHAALRCRLADRIPVGDHQLLVGLLTGLHTGRPGRPLLWHARDYRTTTPVPPAAVPPAAVPSAPVLAEQGGSQPAGATPAGCDPADCDPAASTPAAPHRAAPTPAGSAQAGPAATAGGSR
ncbi:flavin reductase family protein [Streptomyces sp. NPDC013455]|uniref:flavin reductase family protein n=1 Tax=Streptomyces sp. NPDC013455 TaxID=3155605 RepID=UPI0033C7BF98